MTSVLICMCCTQHYFDTDTAWKVCASSARGRRSNEAVCGKLGPAVTLSGALHCWPRLMQENSDLKITLMEHFKTKHSDLKITLMEYFKTKQTDPQFYIFIFTSSTCWTKAGLWTKWVFKRTVTFNTLSIVHTPVLDPNNPCNCNKYCTTVVHLYISTTRTATTTSQ